MSILAVSSAWAFAIRGMSIILFGYGCYLVIKQFTRGKLQPLRWRLLAMIFTNGISNIPIQVIHYQRMFGHNASPNLTSFATVSNAIAMLVTSMLIISIIRFKVKE